MQAQGRIIGFAARSARQAAKARILLPLFGTGSG
jgi:hypothetical protein